MAMIADIDDLWVDEYHTVLQADEIIKKAKAENRKLTISERNRVWRLLDEADKIDEQREDQIRGKVMYRSNQMTEWEPRKVPPQKPMGQPGEPRIEIGSRFRYGRLRAFDPTPQGEERAYRAGMAFAAGIFNKHWGHDWCSRHFGEAERRALAEGVNTTGGFLVPGELEQSIIDNRERFGVARQFVRRIPMGSDTKDVPVEKGGMTAGVVGEGVEIPESDDEWGNVKLVATKVGIRTRISSELDEDAIIDMGDYLTRRFAEELARFEDTLVFVGDGTAAHASIKGVCTLFNENQATFAGAVDAGSGIDTFPEVTVAALSNVSAELPEYAFQRGASWFGSRKARSQIFGRLAMAAAGNRKDELAGRAITEWDGDPVVVTQVMPTAGTDNETMVLYGNLESAVILGDRRGITVGRSDHVHFAEDQIALKVTERIDVNVHDIGDATTAGPIVALIAES